MTAITVAKLAAQLFTVREFTHTARGLAGTLAKVSRIGYPAVQMSSIGAMSGVSPQVTAKDARAMLDDNNLRCIATHRSWDDLRHKTDDAIAFHHALGCDYAAIGGIGSYGERGEAGYRQFVADALPVIARLKEAGIRFGYHNHDFEFARIGGSRRTLYDILIEEGGPDLMLEVDVYWAAHAGLNPERLIERCAGRVPVIHVKDKEVADGVPVMAPVGEGNLDWTHLLPACQAAGVEWYAVEQDTCRRDPFDCLRASFEYLSRSL